jgi:hypothetical protein
VPFEHDHGLVIGFDHSAEVRPKRPGCAVPAREVRPAETAAEAALTAPFGEQQMLLPAAFEADHPALWIGESNPIERLEPQDPPGGA